MTETSFSAMEHLQTLLTCICKIQCYYKRNIFPLVDAKYLFMCPLDILLWTVILPDLTNDVWKEGKVKAFNPDWRRSRKISMMQELVVAVIK